MSVFSVVEKNLTKLVADSPDDFASFSGVESKLSMAFMLYSLRNIFKNFSSQDLEEGIVDSMFRGENHDFGIDAIYLTANGEIINSINEVGDYNRDTKFAFHILQFKKSRGIEQSDLLKLKEGISKVFVSDSFDKSKNLFLHAKMTLLNEIKDVIYGKFSAEQIQVKIYLVFNGIESNVTSNDLLTAQIKDIKIHLSEEGYQYSTFDIVDAQGNLNFSNNNQEIVGTIKYQQSLKYITEAEQDKKLNGYVAVVKAAEIAQLVKAWQGELFEANIRDYYRRNDLNSKIIHTSSDANEAKYFWSFNNGLTITCRKVEELPRDTYRLHGIQIVNGCQTSNALYLAFSNLERFNELSAKKARSEKISARDNRFLSDVDNKYLHEQATVLVKIIETSDPELTYRITETTNSQTPIKTFSLKANDNIQQNIERFLEQEEIYYERRINFYRNQGKKNTVSIQQLFQLYTSQILFKPSQAKNALKVTFNNTYDKVFPSAASKQLDYTVYLVPILIDIEIDKQIKNLQRVEGLDTYNRVLLSYGRLHLGPLFLNEILGAYSAKTIISSLNTVKGVLADKKMADRLFLRALFNLKSILQLTSGQRPESIASGLRKFELDERIARVIANRRMPSS